MRPVVPGMSGCSTLAYMLYVVVFGFLKKDDKL